MECDTGRNLNQCDKIAGGPPPPCGLVKDGIVDHVHGTIGIRYRLLVVGELWNYIFW